MSIATRHSSSSHPIHGPVLHSQETHANLVAAMAELRFDEVGYWSEIKLEILKEYASAYSRILSAQRAPTISHVYIDAFAGAGIHVAKQTGAFVRGSPLNALLIQPPFREYHLIDIAPEKTENLRAMVGDRRDVFVHQGDCNRILIETILPTIRYETYRRGLCILDPYGLDLDWQVLSTAGKMKTLDVFLNFPVADMNRNVLWRDPEGVGTSQKQRLNKYWGDESWREIAYRTDTTLFSTPEKQTNEAVADAFRARLVNVAGFAQVPKPIPMRNTKGATVYYLYFASQKNTAENIVTDIFGKYEGRGGL